MRTPSSLNAVSTMATTKTTFSQSATATVVRSPWHSPMPYLFGGLAAMLGLIVLALLILACSYRKLFRRAANADGGGRDLEAGDEKSGDSGKAFPEFEEKYLVIMAGDVNPTYLATPMFSGACSFVDSKVKGEEMESEKADLDQEKQKQDTGDDNQIATTTLEGRDCESENQAQENPDI